MYIVVKLSNGSFAHGTEPKLIYELSVMFSSKPVGESAFVPHSMTVSSVRNSRTLMWFWQYGICNEIDLWIERVINTTAYHAIVRFHLSLIMF